jgi:hypothetical protein
MSRGVWRDDLSLKPNLAVIFLFQSASKGRMTQPRCGKAGLAAPQNRGIFAKIPGGLPDSVPYSD